MYCVFIFSGLSLGIYIIIVRTNRLFSNRGLSGELLGAILRVMSTPIGSISGLPWFRACGQEKRLCSADPVSTLRKTYVFRIVTRSIYTKTVYVYCVFCIITLFFALNNDKFVIYRLFLVFLTSVFLGFCIFRQSVPGWVRIRVGLLFVGGILSS